MFTDKITLALAEAAKKCMDEDLKGKQHKIDANKNGKIDAQDFSILRNKKNVEEELKGNQHKIDANKNGKIDAQDFKILRKEDVVNEEEGKYGYVAFSHDGKRHELYANSSYEAKQKAVNHFKPPKSKQHLVHVHLAQKDGKDVTHVATESVQEGAIDDLRDRQAAKRDSDYYSSTDKKEPVSRKVQGSQYGGSKQKQEKEIDEETMTATDKAQREKIVKGMKKNFKSFKARYGDRAKDVMYATATKQAMKEDIEQLDELSKDTISSYYKKAAKDMDKHDSIADTLTRKASNSTISSKGHVDYKDRDNIDYHTAKSDKRAAGINMAIKRLAKEDIEQLDELSKDTLQSYTKKAEADKQDSINRYNAHDRDSQGNKIRDKDRSPARRAIDKLLSKRADKRIAGLKTANAKLSKEEVDNETFKKELEDQKKSAAGTKKQPDIAKASVQGVENE